MTFLKLVWKVNFSERKFGEMHWLWKAKRCKVYLHVYFDIILFSCLLSTKLCLRFLLNCIVWQIKGFYQSSLGNKVDFRDLMNVSPNILAKNWNFKKLRHGFVDERALLTTKLMSSCHWKTIVLFCLQKKRPEYTNSD